MSSTIFNINLFTFIITVYIYKTFFDLLFLMSYENKCFYFVFTREKYILAALNNARVINKKASRIYKFFVSAITIFWLKVVGIVFVSSIFLSHTITKSSVITAKYLPLSRPHVAEIQLEPFSHISCFFQFHQHLSLSHFWSELHFLRSNSHLYSHHKCFINILNSFL